MSEKNDYTSGISATIKASEGFDAPWIVVHARDTAELMSHLEALRESPAFAALAELSQAFQGNFEQKPRQNKGGGGWNRSRGAGATAQPQAAPAAQTQPPPAFVPNQQAQPAQWGNQQPQQLLQQELGAQVMGQVPNEVAYCVTHGNAPREYKEAFFNPRTQRQVSASYRCQVQGCKAYWLQQDGTWAQ